MGQNQYHMNIAIDLDGTRCNQVCCQIQVDAAAPSSIFLDGGGLKMGVSCHLYTTKKKKKNSDPK